MTPQQLTGKVTSHLVETVIGQKAFLVHSQVSQDLQSLKQAATNAGFNFNIASGFRDFDRQLLIWNNKMAGHTDILDSSSQKLEPSRLSEYDKVLAILRWSALPGGSRHHWGTDFDVFDRCSLPQGTQLKLEPWEYHSGHQSTFYRWLEDNLHQHGFFFPYAEDLGGVAVEPWHISHQPVAQQCLEDLKISILEREVSLAPILGKQTVLAQLEKIYNQFIANIST